MGVQDVIFNMSTQKQLTNGSDADGSPLSVSDMVTRMQLSFSTSDVQKIGAIAAGLYRDRYGRDAKPAKHEQLVCGRSCPVNHYVLKDHDLLATAISGFKAPKLAVARSG